MDLMRYIFHMCTMNTSYRVNFLIVSKSMCIHLLGDSNTKCTHLGGVHLIACDFETNVFASLFFVVSRGVNTLRECFSQSMRTNNSIRVAMCSYTCSTLVYQVLFFQRLSIACKSLSSWYMQVKLSCSPRRYARF